ncbi:MAG: hypothetical protein AAGA56_17005, partial [Myxococcota bacterium]
MVERSSTIDSKPEGAGPRCRHAVKVLRGAVVLHRHRPMHSYRYIQTRARSRRALETWLDRAPDLRLARRQLRAGLALFAIAIGYTAVQVAKPHPAAWLIVTAVALSCAALSPIFLLRDTGDHRAVGFVTLVVAALLGGFAVGRLAGAVPASFVVLLLFAVAAGRTTRPAQPIERDKPGSDLTWVRAFDDAPDLGVVVVSRDGTVDASAVSHRVREWLAPWPSQRKVDYLAVLPADGGEYDSLVAALEAMRDGRAAAVIERHLEGAPREVHCRGRFLEVTHHVGERGIFVVMRHAPPIEATEPPLEATRWAIADPAGFVDLVESGEREVAQLHQKRPAARMLGRLACLEVTAELLGADELARTCRTSARRFRGDATPPPAEILVELWESHVRTRLAPLVVLAREQVRTTVVVDRSELDAEFAARLGSERPVRRPFARAGAWAERLAARRNV